MTDGGKQLYSRQSVVHDLLRVGYQGLADEALDELPDPVDEDQLDAWCTQHGISVDDLISRMGGSP
jgi:hypothetical protein